MNKYEKAYSYIMMIQAELASDLMDPMLQIPDYRKIQALAAAYTLQDYLANKIAEVGETPEGIEYYEEGYETEVLN